MSKETGHGVGDGVLDGGSRKSRVEDNMVSRKVKQARFKLKREMTSQKEALSGANRENW